MNVITTFRIAAINQFRGAEAAENGDIAREVYTEVWLTYDAATNAAIASGYTMDELRTIYSDMTLKEWGMK